MELYVFPWIEARRIAKPSTGDVPSCLQRVEAGDKFETAKQALQKCSRIFRNAIATGRREDIPRSTCAGLAAGAGGSISNSSRPKTGVVMMTTS
jgi:hypothetical protein